MGENVPRLGMLAILKGYATTPEVRGALRHQRANPGSRIGEVMVERQVLAPAELQDILGLQTGWISGSPTAVAMLIDAPEDPEPEPPEGQ